MASAREALSAELGGELGAGRDAEAAEDRRDLIGDGALGAAAAAGDLRVAEAGEQELGDLALRGEAARRGRRPAAARE
ncbi:MAG: hypothetical protein M5U28_31830 [Sandaracinaceae bacterium]|nr:hypothetical protein [Sandaracinaceae bacterium]